MCDTLQHLIIRYFGRTWTICVYEICRHKNGKKKILKIIFTLYNYIFRCHELHYIIKKKKHFITTRTFRRTTILGLINYYYIQ